MKLLGYNKLCEIKEKVIFITGSSRGLGKQLAEHFAELGAIVIGNYYKSKQEALKVEKRIQTYNSLCKMFYADITNDNDLRLLYKNIMKIYGKIDVLINNAGINSDSYVNLMSIDQWQNIINTNLTGAFLCSRYFSKSMIHQHKGKIINIASLKGQLGSEGQANYAASKAGLIGFSKSLAKELGGMGVSVNVVCPGYITTDLNKENKYKKEIAEDMSVLSIEHGLNDFINFMTFLVSDQVNGISGQVFNLDSRII